MKKAKFIQTREKKYWISCIKSIASLGVHSVFLICKM